MLCGKVELMNSSVIKNYSQLAATPLREDALAILEAGYHAILTREIIDKRVQVKNETLIIDDKHFPLNGYQRIVFVGIGKCALDAGIVFEEKLDGWMTEGVVLDVRGAPLRKIRSHIGTHPFPTEANVEVAKSIAEMLGTLSEYDLLITVISGGASSLLCLPHDMECGTLSLISKTLMDEGADILELNTVRKHTSDIQGGQFAKLAYPATVVSLIFSDVPGDDMSLVASGPTVLDETTVSDAEAVLKKYNILELCKLPNCDLVETPKEEEYFSKVHNILFVTTKIALNAMSEESKKRGYTTEIVNSMIQGEAYEVGKKLMQEATEPKTCRLFGGETTVNVVNEQSEGGRCQEVALGGLSVPAPGALMISATSDGWDNSPTAGALVDELVLTRARELDIDPVQAHKEGTSFDFFSKVASHIDTGRTGANVSDWYFTITS